MIVFFMYLFFFFKHKTAYEMRISDWSSDVCSSDLIAASRGFRRAVHDADLHADLVDEHHHALRARDVAGQLAQCLRHQTRLHADAGVAHLAFDFGLRHQRRDRIDDDHVDARSEEHTSELQSLMRNSYAVFCLKKKQ